MSFTLWVKYKCEQSVSVEFKPGSIDKLKDTIKCRVTDLSKVNNGKIVLRRYGSTTDLEPGITVSEADFRNTDTTPLQVSVAEKTFFVQSYNNEGAPLLGKFERYIMHDDNEFRLFLKSVEAKGLELMSTSDGIPTVVTSLEYITPNESYQINASHITAIRKGVTWSQVEDMVIEEETLLALKSFLNERSASPVEMFPSRVMHKNKVSIMEWDGIIVCEDKVFLLESKQKMTDELVENIIKRLKKFPLMLDITDSSEFKKLIGKQYIGVVCASLFPLDLRKKSTEEGLIVVFPSGNRFKVEAPLDFMCVVNTCTYM